MRLILIPPYKGMNYDPKRGQFMVRELVANMKERGQLERVEVDIDDGHPFPVEMRPLARYSDMDEESFAYMHEGVVKRVRECSEMGKYDAIVTTGTLEPGFFAARFVSKIPVASVLHSALHVASIIGDRIGYLEVAGPFATKTAWTDSTARIVRRSLQNYGFSHKMVSFRHPAHTVSYLAGFVRQYPNKQERIKVPEVKEIVDIMSTECITAVEEDGADCIIFGCSAVQVYADYVREELDKRGYREVPIICSLYAAVEMAKVMVNLKLTQVPGAYPYTEIRIRP